MTMQPQRAVTHLTLTGPCAGVRLCGISPADGPEAAHAVWINTDLPHICSACKAEWDAVTEEMQEGENPCES